MVEDLFKVKDLEKKEKIVRNHYESSYRVELKKDLTLEEIEMLYKNLEKLKNSQFIYDYK